MSLDNLITAIHSSNEIYGKRFVFGITGGGSTSLGHLMGQPGASNTVLEFNCTYACESTQDYVNRDSDKQVVIKSFASLDTAKELGNASLKRALKLLTTQATDLLKLEVLNNAVGIGVTCSLASKNWKRGEHRLFASLITNEKEITFSLNLFKGVEGSPFRSRKEEDDLCGKLIVCICAYECDLLNNETLVSFMLANGLSSHDTLLISDVHLKNTFEDLLDGKIKNVLCLPYSNSRLVKIPDVPLDLLGKYTDLKPKLVMLPGSFNPLHPGHTSALVSSLDLIDPKFNPQGLFELSVFNVDKPKMEIDDLTLRLKNFLDQSIPIFLTNTPRFVDKAKVYPGISYVVGIDTALRLVDPKYTNGSIEKMTDLLMEMTNKGTTFFVLPRTVSTAKIPPIFSIQLEPNEVLSYSMIKQFVPLPLQPFFKEIEENKYMDVSSSSLRNGITKYL